MRQKNRNNEYERAPVVVPEPVFVKCAQICKREFVNFVNPWYLRIGDELVL